MTTITVGYVLPSEQAWRLAGAYVRAGLDAGVPADVDAAMWDDAPDGWRGELLEAIDGRQLVTVSGPPTSLWFGAVTRCLRGSLT